jgi:hypothetical protein
MRPAGVAPGEPSVCLPLCCGPNELRSDHRGLLTRWNHSNLRVRKVAIKFGPSNRVVKQAIVALALRRFNRRLVPSIQLRRSPWRCSPRRLRNSFIARQAIGAAGTVAAPGNEGPIHCSLKTAKRLAYFCGAKCRCWRKASLSAAQRFGCYRGMSGHRADTANRSLMTLFGHKAERFAVPHNAARIASGVVGCVPHFRGSL